MTGKNNGSIPYDGKGASYFGKVAQRVFYFKRNGVNTGQQGGGFTCQIFTGNFSRSNFIAVYQNFAGSSIQFYVISYHSRERYIGAVEDSAIGEGYPFVSGSISNIADGGQYTIIYSRAVVQGNVVNIEGMNGRYHGFYIGTNERGRTRVRGISCNRGANVIITRKINRSVYPTRFGNISFGTRVQVFANATNSIKHKVSLFAGEGATLIFGIQLRLESKTCSPFGDVQPHTQGGGIFTIGNVTQYNAFAHVKEYVVAPTGKVSIGIVYVPSKSVVAIAYRAVSFGRNMSSTADLVVKLASQRSIANQGIIYTIGLAPFFGFHKAHEASAVAVFKVVNNFRTLTISNLQNVHYSRIGIVRCGNGYTGDGFIGGSFQYVTG